MKPLVILALAFGWIACQSRPAPDPSDGAVVYSSLRACEQATGASCSFQMCDYVPPGKTYEEVCGEDFREGWVPLPSPPRAGARGRRILDIELVAEAPFSTASLLIRRDGSIIYSAEPRGQQAVRDSSSLSAGQVDSLAAVIDDIDFPQMRDRPRMEDDPQDGSTYAITVRILPAGSAELADPAVHVVRCYEFACEQEFLRLKDRIVELWGGEFLEAGV